MNKRRGHAVSKEQAVEYISDAKFSLSRWNGRYINYYGEDGAAFVNRDKKIIRTAFSAKEFNDKIRKFLEVLKKNGY